MGERNSHRSCRCVREGNPPSTHPTSTGGVTQCPFTPAEIGGDDAFYPDATFFKKVVDKKARSPKEAWFRIGMIYRNREGMRLCASESNNQVCSKYRMWLPTEAKLRKYLPEDAIVPISDENESLRSLRVPGFLETPQKTFFRMVKESYYRAVLRGIPYDELPKLELIEPPPFNGGEGVPPYTHVPRFLKHWVNPGFSWRSAAEYLVRTDRAILADHMHLALDYGRERPPGLRKEMSEWLSQSFASLRDLEGEDLVTKLLNCEDLPTKLKDRLHMFIESDSMIKAEFTRTLPPAGKIVLVSRDLRLAADLVRLSHARGVEHQVYCLRPVFYLLGRMEEIGFDPITVIEDPGAMVFEDMTLFSEGCPPEWAFDEIETKRVPRYSGVWVIDRQRPNSSRA